MYCPNCRNNIPDNTVSCPSCGYSLQNGFSTPQAGEQTYGQQPYGQMAETTGYNQSQYAQQPYNPSAPTPNPYSYNPYGQAAYANTYDSAVATKKKNNGLKIGIIIALIVALGVGVWYFFLKDDAHDSPEAAVKTWAEAMNAKDAKALYNISTAPIYDRKNGGNSISVSTYEDLIDDYKSYWGDNYKFTVEVKDVEYSDNVSDFDFIEKIAYVKTKTTLTANGESQTFDDGSITCVKIDGKWYVEN